MTETTLLLDLNGEVWLPSLGLAIALNLPINREEMLEQLVRQRGWAVVSFKATVATVRLNPGRTSDSCVREVVNRVWMAKCRKTTVWIDGTYSGRFHLTKRHQLGAFLTSLTEGHRQVARPRFECRQSAMAPDEREIVAAAYVMGLQSDSIRTFAQRLKGIIGTSWSLWHVPRDGEDAICAAAGGGYTPYNPGWAATAEGGGLRQFGNVAYSRFVLVGLREIHAAGSARCDEVDALALFPQAGPARLRYRRLLVPIDRPDGERLILSTPRSKLASGRSIVRT